MKKVLFSVLILAFSGVAIYAGMKQPAAVATDSNNVNSGGTPLTPSATPPGNTLVSQVTPQPPPVPATTTPPPTEEKSKHRHTPPPTTGVNKQTHVKKMLLNL